WSRPEGISIVNEINEHHTNKRYFEDVVFPESITATTDLKEASAGREIIVIVIPTVGIRDLPKQLNEIITYPKIIVHASEGLEQRTHLTISIIMEEEISEEKRKGIAVLSGPCHAEEVVVQDLTSIASASENEEVAKIIQNLFMKDRKSVV